MSAAHTEGLLAVSEQAAHILKRVDELGPTTELIGSTMGDNADANARRLAACWNAFDGMPTEAPEELAEIGGVQGLTNDLSAAMTVMEAARALLDETLRSFSASRAAREAETGQPVAYGGLPKRIAEFLGVEL